MVSRSYRRKVGWMSFVASTTRNLTLFFFGAAAWTTDGGMSWLAILGFFLFGQVASLFANTWEYRYRMICMIPDPWLEFRYLFLGPARDQETHEK